MSNGANTWFSIVGYCLMKYLKKTIYYFLFILVFLSFSWPFNASGKQPTISVPAAKLTRDMDLDEIVFFWNQLDEDRRNIMVKFLRGYNESESPILEFMRLSPDKYYLNVHKFDSNFIVNFSERFHNKWKIYVVKPHGKKLFSINNSITARNVRVDNVVDYKAGPKKIQTLMQKGLLRFKAESHKKAFISKTFYNSVQNDNLPKGLIYETMGKTSLPEIYHLTSNSFSNAWLIDTSFIKKHFPKKIVKASGSDHEVGFIIEFSHKKLFIISVVVSGFFILIVVVVNLFKSRNDPISL